MLLCTPLPSEERTLNARNSRQFEKATDAPVPEIEYHFYHSKCDHFVAHARKKDWDGGEERRNETCFSKRRQLLIKRHFSLSFLHPYSLIIKTQGLRFYHGDSNQRQRYADFDTFSQKVSSDF